MKMVVLVGKRTYQMSRKEYNGLLKIASEQVPLGVYAIEKRNTAELRHDKCTSTGKVKELIRNWKRQGYKVYANRGGS